MRESVLMEMLKTCTVIPVLVIWIWMGMGLGFVPKWTVEQ